MPDGQVAAACYAQVVMVMMMMIVVLLMGVALSMGAHDGHSVVVVLVVGSDGHGVGHGEVRRVVVVADGGLVDVDGQLEVVGGHLGGREVEDELERLLGADLRLVVVVGQREQLGGARLAATAHREVAVAHHLEVDARLDGALVAQAEGQRGRGAREHA